MDGGAERVARKQPTRKRSARPTRVVIAHNVDFDLQTSAHNADENASRNSILEVAEGIIAVLSDDEHTVTRVPVDGDLWEMRARILALEPDVVFNLCETVAGDARLESSVPIVLESIGVAYTGSPPAALSAALYKDRIKDRLRAAGVPTPEAQVVTDARALSSDMRYPAIVKPTREDGSLGISSTSVVHDESSCRAKVSEVVARFRQPVLVERFIAGREFNVALFGFPTARILPLREIEFSSLPAHLPKIVSYDAKWSAGSDEDRGTVPITFPQLPVAVAARIRRAASEAFRAVGIRDYGRVDIRLADDGTPYVIDVNPNCDLSPDAGLAQSAAAVGIDYPTLVRLLVRYGLRRAKREVAPRRVVEAPAQEALFR